MRFKVKKGMLVKLVFLVIPLIFIALAVIFYLEQTEDYMSAVIGLLTVVLVDLIFLFSSVYALKEDYLYIRLGFISKKVYYEHIIAIEKDRMLPNNNFAMSMDVVKITLNKGLMRMVAISPEDRDVFIQELKSRCNHLESRKKIEEDFDW